MEALENTLREVVGPLPTAQLRSLLRRSGMDVSAAVALHFAEAPTQQGSTTESELLRTLKELGISGSDAQLRRLLERAGNSAEEAVSLFFQEGGRHPGAGPSSAPLKEEIDLCNDSSDDSAPPSSRPGPSGAANDRRPAQPAAPVAVAPAINATPVRTHMTLASSSDDSSSEESSDSDSNSQGEGSGSSDEVRVADTGLAPADNEDSSSDSDDDSDSDDMDSDDDEGDEDDMQDFRNAPFFGYGRSFLSMRSNPYAPRPQDAAEPPPQGAGAASDTSSTSCDERGQELLNPWSWQDDVKKWCEVRASQDAEKLSAATLCTARARQPQTWPAKLHLPFPQFRKPKTLRLFCEDPDQVPADVGARPHPEIVKMSDRVTLGSVSLPLLPPHTRAFNQGEASHVLYSRHWHKGPNAQRQQKAQQLVSEFLSSGKLPASSLTLVGGCTMNTNAGETGGFGWTRRIFKVAVAVLEGAPGYSELSEAWTGAQLPVHVCQTPKQIQDDGTEAMYCLVVGYLPAEYMSLLRALALLSQMPQNLYREESGCISNSCYKGDPQEKMVQVAVTSLTGLQPTAPAGHAAPSAPTTAATSKEGSTEPEADVPKGEQPAGKRQRVSSAGGAVATVVAAAKELGQALVRGPGRKRKAAAAAAAAEPEAKPEPEPQPQAKPRPQGTATVSFTITIDMTKLLAIQNIPATKPGKGAKMPEEVKTKLPSKTGGYGDKQPRQRVVACNSAFEDILHALLTYGQGLYVGPDCDGLLNYCDKDDNSFKNKVSAKTGRPHAADPTAKVAGITLKEHADMAVHEVKRLTALAAEAAREKRRAAASVKMRRRMLPRDQRHLTAGDSDHGHKGGRGHQYRGPSEHERAVSYEQYLAHCQANRRAADIALSLARRAQSIFHAAGLCPAPPNPPPLPNAAAGSSEAGPSNCDPSAAANDLEQPLLPWVPDVPLGLVLAAEKVGGKKLLQREARGWIVRGRADEARGCVVGREQLPTSAFSVHSLLDSLAMPADYEAAPVLPQLNTAPKMFQRQGLAWMLNRERKSDSVGRGVLHLNPLWIQFVTESGFIFYIQKRTHAASTITLEFTCAPTETTCGGFLCDEMGLGKTLESLMLVMSNPSPPGWAVEGDTYPLPSQRDELQAAPIKATLLIVPSNLITQWQDEIKMHVKRGKLRWGVYQGGEMFAATLNEDDEDEDDEGTGTAGGRKLSVRKRKRARAPGQSPEPQEGEQGAAAPATTGKKGKPKVAPFILCQEPETNTMAAISHLDLVLMSYEQLRKELSKKSELRKYGFWRIMLDEAQLVANSNSVAAEMASDLLRRHAWVVTGTPISSRLSEVAGLCKFLAAEPFWQDKVWKSSLQTPYEQHTRAGLLSMRALLRGLMLRRTKAQVEAQLALPPCTALDYSVTLSKVERAFYDQLKVEFKRSLKALQTAQRQAERRPTNQTGKTMGLLTSLRQCCCHPYIVRRDASGQQTGNTRASMREIMGRLVMQAFGKLDQAVASLYQSKMLQVAAKMLVSKADPKAKRPAAKGKGKASGAAAGAQQAAVDDNAFMALLLEMQAQGQLSALYDLRKSANMRAEGGGADVNQVLLDMEFDALLTRAGTVTAMLSSGESIAGADSIIQDAAYSLFITPAGMQSPPAAAPDAPARPSAPATAAPAGSSRQAPARASSGAAASKKAEGKKSGPRSGAAKQEEKPPAADPPVLVEVQGVRDRRPFGQLPDAVFAAESVLAVLNEGGDQRMERSQEEAEMLQLAAQSELEAEIKQAADAQRDRVRRWRRLEMDLLVLQIYVLRKTVPQCVELAKQAEQAQAAEAAGAEAGPSRTWGTGVSEAVRTAAVQMLATRQRLDLLRTEAGLPPAIDVDNAELRRSKVLRKKKASAAGDALELANSEDEFIDGDDIDSSDDDGAQKKKAKTDLKLGPADPVAMFLRGEVVVRRLETLLQVKDPVQSAATEIAREETSAQKAYHELQHMMHREEEALQGEGGKTEGDAAAAGKGAPAAGDAAGSNQAAGTSGSAAAPGPSGAAAQAPAAPRGFALPMNAAAQALIDAALAANKDTGKEGDTVNCPICFDHIEKRVVTACGHHYCSDCIESIVPESGRGAPCPICRTLLTRGDLFETLSVAEAERQRAQQAAELANEQGNAEYGAKVSRLLLELSDMATAEPGAKALVLSSWGRLLRLVGSALEANKVPYAMLVGRSPAERQKALHRFQHDPQCKVLLLLMATSGGAAGLTLTQASTAFILEPSPNPGLEAQASARIHRLGQTRPTRVIRLIANDTVEQNVLALQKHKLSTQGKAQNKPGGGAGPAGPSGAAGPSSVRVDANGAGPSNAAPPAGEGEQAEEESEQEQPVALATDTLDSGALFKFFGNL